MSLLVEWAQGLEATALAQHLKASRWTYPLVSAAHILGIALLLGAVVPMALGLVRRGAASVEDAGRRRFAMAGLALAGISGAALFATQAGDYASSGWFGAKLAVIALLLLHAGHYLWRGHGARLAGALSVSGWLLALWLGRMIAFG